MPAGGRVPMCLHMVWCADGSILMWWLAMLSLASVSFPLWHARGFGSRRSLRSLAILLEPWRQGGIV